MTPLLAGAVVHVVAPRRRVDSSASQVNGPVRWVLFVDRGPDAGLVLPLLPGPSVVGRAGGAHLRLTDLGASRRHVELVASAAGVTVCDLGGTNGTWVDDRRLGDTPVVLSPGQTLRLGGTDLTMYPAPRESRHLVGDAEGHLRLEAMAPQPRPPRVEITFPDSPASSARSRFPLLALVVPLALAGVLAAVLRSPTMLLFGLSGPVLSLGAWASTRRGTRRRSRYDIAEARRARDDADAKLTFAVASERLTLEREHPSPAALLAAVEARSRRVWSARSPPPGPGGLDIRLGLGRPRSEVVLLGATAPLRPTLEGAPITVDLEQVRVLRLRGDPASVRGAATNLLTRAAVQYGPGRVEIGVVVDSWKRAEAWSFARLLPHVRLVQVLAPSSVTQASAEDVLALAGLAGLVGLGLDGALTGSATRGGPTRERDPTAAVPPFLLLVLDGWAGVGQLPGAPALLDTTSGRHRCVVILGDDPGVDTTDETPPPATAVLTLDRHGARLTRHDEGDLSCRPDLPGPAYAWRVARALAPLREAGVQASSEGIPDRVRLLDLHATGTAGRGRPTRDHEVGAVRANGVQSGGLLAGDLARRWQSAPRSTCARLGLSGDGVFDVDLTLDGPHALVAGTTGSGKSELLQTLVSSLALANRPDEMSFVLVDYKGGAAFRECARLPHVVGWVTDLDAHLTRRALLSLTAEVRRREQVLAAVGVPDLGAYQEGYDRAGPDDSPLPRLARLVIVVDEFRVLAEELPDFVHGLVRLAAVGRSLGIHLVLATQRPGGVVTADMRANLSLRVALRVRDRTDSLDVIDSPDAARISAATPGRAFVRGAQTGLTELQTAQVTGRPAAAEWIRVTDVTRWWDRPRTDRTGGRTGGGRPASVGPSGTTNTMDETVTADAGSMRRNLDDIIDVTRSAAEVLGIRATPSPWLPPLPDAVDLATLTSAQGTVALGLEDRPAEQRQASWCWPLDGHLGIAGGPSSGRTTALRSVAGALAASGPADRMHLYAIGTESLASLALLPHTAAVANIQDAEHVSLVIDRLVSTVRERSVGVSHPRPTVVLLLDGWEQLAALDGGNAAGELRALLDPGRTVGFLAVISGGRAVLSGQLASTLTYRLALRLADPVELALAGVPAKAAPLRQPPGRAVHIGSHREIQLGLLGGSTVPAVQDAALDDIAERWRVGAGGEVGVVDQAGICQHAGHRAGRQRGGRAGARGDDVDDGRPRPVQVLPATVSTAACGPFPGGICVGVREGDLLPVGVQRRRGQRRLLVVGPPSSGRTTALATMAVGLVRGGRPIVVVGRELGELVRAGLTLDGSDGADVDRLVAARRAHPDLCVLVDDAEYLSAALGSVVREIVRLVDDDDGFVAAATTTSVVDHHGSALVTDLARAETGLLLHPRPGTRVFGLTVPARFTHPTDPPGRGLLVVDRTVVRLQIAGDDPLLTS